MNIVPVVSFKKRNEYSLSPLQFSGTQQISFDDSLMRVKLLQGIAKEDIVL